MCFPFYHSYLEKKWLILENWYFCVFSFGNWANVIWVMKMKSRFLLFQGRNVSLLPFHHPSVILSQFFCPASVPFFSVWQIVCPILCGESGLLSSIFICFYLFLSVRMPFPAHSPAPFVWFLFLHSKHTPPSNFLFFLNVIVKCSSEMTLNMCTLTEGIHLVIYFLLPLLCGLFLVSLSFSLIFLVQL